MFSPKATALLPVPPALDFGRIAGVLNGEAKRKVERRFERLGFRLNGGNLFVDWNHEWWLMLIDDDWWWLMMIDDDWWWLVMIGDDDAVDGDSDYRFQYVFVQHRLQQAFLVWVWKTHPEFFRRLFFTSAWRDWNRFNDLWLKKVSPTSKNGWTPMI